MFPDASFQSDMITRQLSDKCTKGLCDDKILEAYQVMRHQQDVAVDLILVDPDLRNEYLRRTRQRIGPASERALLSRLIQLRKRGLLPTVYQKHREIDRRS